MTLEQRIYDLERTKRRGQWAMCLMGLLVVAGMVMGQKPQRTSERVIWAQRFEVRDQNEVPTMSLSVGGDSAGPRLLVQDENGQVRIELGIHDNQPVLLFMDEHGQPITHAAAEFRGGDVVPALGARRE